MFLQRAVGLFSQVGANSSPPGTVVRPVYTEESAKGVGPVAAPLETGKQMFPRQPERCNVGPRVEAEVFT